MTMHIKMPSHNIGGTIHNKVFVAIHFVDRPQPDIGASDSSEAKREVSNVFLDMDSHMASTQPFIFSHM